MKIVKVTIIFLVLILVVFLLLNYNNIRKYIYAPYGQDVLTRNNYCLYEYKIANKPQNFDSLYWQYEISSELEYKREYLEVVKLRESYLKKRSRSKYLRQPWAKPENSHFLFPPDASLVNKSFANVYPVYVFKEANGFYFSSFPFYKIKDLLKFNYRFSGFQWHIYYCIVKNEGLYYLENKKSELLFHKGESEGGYFNCMGKYFYIRHYDSIKFFDTIYKNVDEYSLITYNSDHPMEFLIWFDSDFKVLRMDKSYYYDKGYGIYLKK